MCLLRVRSNINSGIKNKKNSKNKQFKTKLIWSKCRGCLKQRVKMFQRRFSLVVSTVLSFTPSLKSSCARACVCVCACVHNLHMSEWVLPLLLCGLKQKTIEKKERS